MFGNGDNNRSFCGISIDRIGFYCMLYELVYTCVAFTFVFAGYIHFHFFVFVKDLKKIVFGVIGADI